MKRLLAPLALLSLLALAGCSSTPSSVPSGASPAATASLPSSASQPAVEPTSTSGPPSSTPVVGGTATDFCGAFAELQAVSESPAGDLVTTGTQFRAAAADIRKYAPAEIASAANTYADLMDSIGKAAQSGSMDEASLSKAVSDGMGQNATDIATTAVWVSKNCP